MERTSDETVWNREEYSITPRPTKNLGLSPIPEDLVPSYNALSPSSEEFLPELTIERQKRHRDDDESEEAYDRLEVKMKKLYRKLFLGKTMVEDSETEITYDDNNFISKKICNNNNGGPIITNMEINVQPIDLTDEETLNITRSPHSTFELEYDKSQHPTSSSNSSESEIKEGRAVIEGTRSTTSDNSKSAEEENDVRETHSEIYSNESNSEENMNRNNSQYKSKSSDDYHAIFMKVNALVHAEEIEVMRRQTFCPTLEDSFREGNILDFTPELNTRAVSMEHPDGSTADASTSTEVGSNEFNPSLIISTPIRTQSPIIGMKRPSNDVNNDIQAKRKQTDDDNVNVEGDPSHKFVREIGTQVKPIINNVGIKTKLNQALERGFKYASTQIDTNGRKINVEDVGVQAELVTANAEAQTDAIENSDKGTQTTNGRKINVEDVGVQTELVTANAEAQIDAIENSDKGTQTTNGRTINVEDVAVQTELVTANAEAQTDATENSDIGTQTTNGRTINVADVGIQTEPVTANAEAQTDATENSDRGTQTTNRLFEYWLDFRGNVNSCNFFF